ncbi:MAG TPA: tetratricopeptide repeat protein [Dongiaceae bacterium]|nr:tetratricopeptide repeat protein [Dongiaceae bacterium]
MICLTLGGCATAGGDDTGADDNRLIAPLSQESVDAALQAPELSQAVTARAEHRYDDMVSTLRTGAGHGNPVAQLQLAELYMRGTFVPQDQSEADRWLQAAAGQGLGEAQIILAERSFAGTDGKQDARQGWRWLRHAEGQERPAIWAMSGKIYLDGVVPVAPDSAQAVLASSVLTARAPDTVAALYYFHRAADAGNVEGEMALCFFYMEGQGGQVPAAQLGQPWCDRAAARGNMDVRKYTAVRSQLPDPLPQPGADGPVLIVLKGVGQGMMTLALAALYILADSGGLHGI